jgi:hypothetical protein
MEWLRCALPVRVKGFLEVFRLLENYAEIKNDECFEVVWRVSVGLETCAPEKIYRLDELYSNSENLFI